MSRTAGHFGDGIAVFSDLLDGFNLELSGKRYLLMTPPCRAWCEAREVSRKGGAIQSEAACRDFELGPVSAHKNLVM